MALSSVEIPTFINKSLDRRYHTDYHDHFGTEGWRFDLSALKPVESAVIEDVVKLFRSSQRWRPEAVATSQDRTAIQRYGLQDRVSPITTIHIGLHAEAQVPTRSEWFVKPLRRRTFLDFTRVLIKGWVEEERYGLKHEMLIVHDLPFLGPFEPFRKLETSESPYFIKGLYLRPFYYTVPQIGKITGEDTTRMFLDIDLEDGRNATQAAIDRKTEEHQGKLGVAIHVLEQAQHRYEQILIVTEDELTGQERALLEKLSSRPDPLRQ